MNCTSRQNQSLGKRNERWVQRSENLRVSVIQEAHVNFYTEGFHGWWRGYYFISLCSPNGLFHPIITLLVLGDVDTRR